MAVPPLCRRRCSLRAVSYRTGGRDRLAGQQGAQPVPALAASDGARLISQAYWAAVITEDWRFRMVTPPKGDAAGVPLNDAGQKAAEAWDPQKDIAAGEQCRAFGAGGVMRMPIRLRVSWQDETTLKFETDNGQQVRLFRFGGSQSTGGEPQWQGQSVASWETVAEGQGIAPAGGGGGGGRGGGANPATQLSGLDEGASPPACVRGTCAGTACPTRPARS